jgi:hypothetical protein
MIVPDVPVDDAATGSSQQGSDCGCSPVLPPLTPTRSSWLTVASSGGAVAKGVPADPGRDVMATNRPETLSSPSNRAGQHDVIAYGDDVVRQAPEEAAK